MSRPWKWVLVSLTACLVMLAGIGIGITVQTQHDLQASPPRGSTATVTCTHRGASETATASFTIG